MRSDKGKAFVLRRNGKSYREISQELGVAKSTLSNWFKGVDFSKAIREELSKEASKKSAHNLRELNRVRGVALAVQYEQAEKEAAKAMHLYRNVPLFTSAVACYWGEGDKATKGLVKLTNADPKMIKLFKHFLTELCAVPEESIKGAIYLSGNLDETKCRRYWIRQTGIKKLHKTQILPSRSKTPNLGHGTFTILVSNTYLKRKMLYWIDQLPEIVLNTVPKRNKRP